METAVLSRYHLAMAASLLMLKTGWFRRRFGCSLEFEVDDIQAVREAICDLYGTLDVEYGLVGPDGAEAAIYRFGGLEFAFQNAWDDPCLITSSKAGVLMLTHIHDRVNA